MTVSQQLTDSHSRVLCLSAVVTGTRSKAKIKELAESIDEGTITSFFLYPGSCFPLSDYISEVEENPIFVLSEMVRRTVGERDRVTPRLVLVESTSRLLDLLELTDDKRTFINAFGVIISRDSAVFWTGCPGGTATPQKALFWGLSGWKSTSGSNIGPVCGRLSFYIGKV